MLILPLCVVALVTLLGGWLASSPRAVAAPAGEAAKKKKKTKKKRCTGEVAYLASGKRCMRTGLRCTRRRNADYNRWGWKCVKKRSKPRRGRGGRGRRKAQYRLVRTSLRHRRAGRAVIVGRDGRVGLRMALQAFSQRIRRLPGVRHRRGAVGRIRSGTGPIRWLSRYRSKLTRRQRRVLDAARRPPPPRARSSVDDETRKKYEAMFQEAQKRLAARVGHPLPAPVHFALPSQPAGSGSCKEAIACASTDPGFSRHSKSPCYVIAQPAFQTQSEAFQRFILVHELFHCYQYTFDQDAEHFNARPAWLVEGGAMWAGYTVADEWNGHAVHYDDFWRPWIKEPWRSLNERDYTAVGFFARLAEAGVDPWKLMPSLFEVGVGKEYDVAVDAGGQSYWDWAAQAFARQPDWGHLWELRGPGLYGMPFVRMKRAGPLSVKAGGATLHGPPRGNNVYTVKLNAPVIKIEGTAFGRFRAADGTQGPLAPGLYCTTSEGCYCPRVAKGDAVFAVSGVKGEDKVRVRGLGKSACGSPKSNVTVTGPLNHTFTEPATCGDYFGGYDVVLAEVVGGEAWIIRTIVGEGDFHGAGSYALLGHDRFGSFAELASGRGLWGTDQGEDGKEYGRTVLHPGLRSGSLSAQMPPTKWSGGSAHVSGGFYCKD